MGRPILTVGVSPDSIEEGARTRITINAVPAPSAALTIPFAISGTGITSADYALTTLTGTTITTDQVTMPVGAASVALLLTAVDDADATETLDFQLTVPALDAGYTLSRVYETQVTIEPTASPLTVKFSRAAVSIKEAAAANPQTNTVAFNVVLSELPRRTIEIPVTTGGGTATAGADYTDASGTLTFAGSTLRQRVLIEFADDDVYEGDETFMVTFGALPSGVTAGTPASVTVTIEEDEAPELVSISAAHGEIGSGRIATIIRITANFVPPSDLQIPLSLSTNVLTLGTDYTLTEILDRSGGRRPVTTADSMVTLPAGATSRAFRLEIIPTRPASSRGLRLTLRAGTGYTVSPTANSTLVIFRSLRAVQFSNAAVSVDEDAGTVTVGITGSNHFAVWCNTLPDRDNGRHGDQRRLLALVATDSQVGPQKEEE